MEVSHPAAIETQGRGVERGDFWWRVGQLERVCTRERERESWREGGREEGGREGGKDTQRGRQKNRETDQSDRQTDRQTETDRQTDRQTDQHRHTQTEGRMKERLPPLSLAVSLLPCLPGSGKQ